MAHLHPHRADDDQVFQKYLDRAITEIHELGDEIAACGLCDHDDTPGFGTAGSGARRVLGTGHPLADVMLVKWSPGPAELDEGVAFHGRAGEAIRRSVERLAIDPLDLYGTNCVKCSSDPTDCQRTRCPGWLAREIRIVGPKLLVVMGHEALDAVNALALADAAPLEAVAGEVQRWTHTCEALWCPDIDRSLDRPASKQAFWRAFRAVGPWYADKPPF